MITIAKQAPALQILLPFFGALFCALSFNVKAARWITLLIMLANFAISIYCTEMLPLSYVYGNWSAHIGIEHLLDYLNQPLIVLVNGILLFLIIFCNNYLMNHVLKYINGNRKHLFYSILLFAHTGFVGTLTTNDLFNLYVFIEISSLSTYILFAQGIRKEALTSSLNYLIIGTISATLILIGIGFLYSLTGHLNMSYVASLLYKSEGFVNLKLASISFMLIGFLLKIGIFPMHRWLVSSYKSVPAVILCYSSTLSSIVSIYLFLRLGYFVDYEIAGYQLANIFRLICAFSLIYCSWQAGRAYDFKMLIGYASIAQISMILLILTYPNSRALAYEFMCIDVINKLSLFLVITFYEHTQQSSNFSKMASLPISATFKCLISFVLLFSVGLPISSMFMLKLAAFDLALDNCSYIVFAILVLANLASLQYHYKIFKNLVLQPANLVENNILAAVNLPLALLVILQFVSLFYLRFDLDWLEIGHYLK